MKQQTIFTIELPFFPGFYESFLYNSDMVWYEFNDKGNLAQYRDYFGDNTLTEDDLDIDFDQYTDDVSKSFVRMFYCCDECPDFIEDMKFNELVSPKYYNYSTDRLYVDIKLTDDWKKKVFAFMDENEEWLSKRIASDWTSYDGFCSFMSNELCQWREEFEKPEPDERYIEYIIRYMMYKQNKNISDELSCDVLGEICISSYVINTKEKQVECK